MRSLAQWRQAQARAQPWIALMYQILRERPLTRQASLPMSMPFAPRRDRRISDRPIDIEPQLWDDSIS